MGVSSFPASRRPSRLACSRDIRTGSPRAGRRGIIVALSTEPTSIDDRPASAGRPDGPWAMWGLAALLYFVALFHRMSLGVASLEAQRRYGVASGALATFSVLQLTVYLVMQVPSGVLADRLGPRRMLTFGLCSMAAGEVVFAFSRSLPGGLAGRALVGLGDACIFLNVLRLAQWWFPASRYALLATLTGLAGGLGQLLTTFPLQFALSHAGWTRTFVTSAGVTAVLAILAWRRLRDRPAYVPAPAAERLPARLLVARTRADLVAAVGRRGTRLGLWTHFTLMGPFVAFTALWGFPFLVKGQGYSRGTASGLLTITVATFVAWAPTVGWLVGRNRERREHLVLGVAVAVGAAWILALSWPAGRLPFPVLAGMLVTTGAAGATSMLSFDIGREANPPERGGTASGIVNLGGFIAASVAELAVGTLLDAGGASGAVAFRGAMIPVPVMIVVGTTVLGWSALTRRFLDADALPS